MAFTTYEEAREALDAINARRNALSVPGHKSFGSEADFLAAHAAWSEAVAQVNADAAAAGFVRIFDNTFKLAKAHVALPSRG